MTTRKSSTSLRRTPTRRRTGSTPRWYPTRRRRRPGVSSTIGSALGMLAVTTLLGMSWPARIGLLALVLVVGLGYLLWRHRAEIAAGAAAPDAAGAAVPDAAGAAAPDAAPEPAGPGDGIPPGPQDAPPPGGTR